MHHFGGGPCRRPARRRGRAVPTCRPEALWLGVPASRRRYSMRRLARFLVVGASLLALVPLAPVGSRPAGAVNVADFGDRFKATCAYSHSASDDPIVFPGMPGASHRHDFGGNPSTSAYSTPETLLTVAGMCDIPED